MCGDSDGCPFKVTEIRYNMVGHIYDTLSPSIGLMLDTIFDFKILCLLLHLA